ncbi:MAG: ATP synthase F1 subunit epsilon [Deltaproteobacteria bacterium]|nr:ATP synthase F1 subunit epsilon [Deltaproteobacteria bacterium]MBI3293754.1 ATP synthase F1 subunit epsilon [Deltaproteobacteria bacterium]
MITVDVVTPTRRLVDGVKVDALKVPAYRGELTILPGHTELLTLLNTGVMSFTQDGRERKFAVSFGFLDVRGDKAIVLAETCEEASDIDADRAKAAQKKAEEALAAALTDDKFKKYQLKLQRAVIRQHLSE